MELWICSCQIHSWRQDVAPPGPGVQRSGQETQLYKSCHFQGPRDHPSARPHLQAGGRDSVASLPSSKPQPAFPPGTLFSTFVLPGDYPASLLLTPCKREAKVQLPSLPRKRLVNGLDLQCPRRGQDPGICETPLPTETRDTHTLQMTCLSPLPDFPSSINTRYFQDNRDDSPKVICLSSLSPAVALGLSTTTCHQPWPGCPRP